MIKTQEPENSSGSHKARVFALAFSSLLLLPFHPDYV